MSAQTSLRDEALQLAQHAKMRGLTQSAIAAALEASQSQISRIFSGTSKRRSKLFVAVCKYVFSDAQSRPENSELVGGAELHQAVDEVWDGTSEHAKALVGVIRSLAALNHCDKHGGTL
ncbi:helix-turn-helix domain-containing protein [Uliginosibacterium gangwonense]|uniref:helix-turn-helix domain-containing protein n=1 Tax=Uliginosibacterium gangwonense TaxID=392736 RepID=UPI00036DD0EA|nr:helix-turn-helix transcriptional regulator [Uliginosibacterium gangwonense]